MSLPARPDGFAQPDLVRALGDRGQHDVHDPDPAHRQRDAGDAAQEDGQRVGHLRDRVEGLLLAGHREVIGAGRGVVAQCACAPVTSADHLRHRVGARPPGR